MAIYRAQFSWPLPADRNSLARFAEALSESAGYPCGATVVRDTSGEVAALLSFPRLVKGNFISLSAERCELEFAPIPFFWGHATRSVQTLGGTFTKPVISDGPDWTPRQWHELKWTERALIRAGFGGSVL